jgi:hypothetical protein
VLGAQGSPCLYTCGCISYVAVGLVIYTGVAFDELAEAYEVAGREWLFGLCEAGVVFN